MFDLVTTSALECCLGALLFSCGMLIGALVEALAMAADCKEHIEAAEKRSFAVKMRLAQQAIETEDRCKALQAEQQAQHRAIIQALGPVVGDS